MVQIIEENRRPSTRDAFFNMMGQGANAMAQSLMGEKNKAQMQQENEQIKKTFGVDLTGINNPEARKAILTESLKGMSRENILKKKSQQFSDILNQRNEPESFGEEINNVKDLASFQSQEEQGNAPSQQRKSQRAQKYTDQQILQATNLDPNLGREMRMANDQINKQQRHEEKFGLEKEKSSSEYKRQQQLESSQAQADVKYNQQLQETSKQHELKEQTLDRLEKLNKKGVTGKPWEKLAEKAGLVNITTEGRREFAADVKNLITDIRSILGGQFSNFEFQTILNAYPSADFSKEANSAIIRNLKEFQGIKKKEVEFAQAIKKENGGKIPVDFQALVNEKVRDYTSSRASSIKENTRKILNEEYAIPKDHTLMFDTQGEPLSVPDSEVAKYLDMEATLP